MNSVAIMGDLGQGT